jgi:hypothetical protein
MYRAADWLTIVDALFVLGLVLVILYWVIRG